MCNIKKIYGIWVKMLVTDGQTGGRTDGRTNMGKYEDLPPGEPVIDKKMCINGHLHLTFVSNSKIIDS